MWYLVASFFVLWCLGGLGRGVLRTPFGYIREAVG